MAIPIVQGTPLPKSYLMPRLVEGSMQLADMPAHPSSSNVIKSASEIMRSSESKVIRNTKVHIENVVEKNYGLGRLFEYFA